VADWSLFLIFALVLFQLGVGVLPAWHPDWSPVLTWFVALAAAILFFGSIVVHELSHAIVGRMNGIPVRRITLFLFGGMAHMEGEPPSPKSELLMAGVGPIVSLAIGVVSIALGVAISGEALSMLATDPAGAYAQLGPVATLLLWLGPVNVLLGVFNLVPGFPLDGGRVLRALLWWGTGDLKKATRWASGVGRLFGLTLIALGVFAALGGSLLQGVWLVLIGWFLSSAARAGYQQVVVREALDGVPVALVMRSRLETVEPMISVDRLVYDFLMATDQQAFPVLDGGRLVGIITMQDVRRIPREEWPVTPVSRIMTPVEQLVTIDAGSPASEALEKLASRDVDQIPVLEHGALRGMVRRQDVMKWIAMNEPGLPA
ncbi:MAG: site-2 protease family protein, partial [Myxococcota bacterium]|nr:site-2 protease family protein [Myxococcota bacterium]